MRIGRRTLAMLLTLLLTIGVFAGLTLPASAADGTWELVTDYSSLDTSAVYVIAGNIKGGTTWYALKSSEVTSAANLACGSTLTIANNKITSTVADTDKWKVESTGTSGVYYIKSNQGTYYLQNDGATGSTVTTKSGTDANNQWRIHYAQTSGSSTVTGLYNVGKTRELGCYNSTTWRCYASSNYSNLAGAEVVLYKYVAGTTTTSTLSVSSVADVVITETPYGGLWL